MTPTYANQGALDMTDSEALTEARVRPDPKALDAALHAYQARSTVFRPALEAAITAYLSALGTAPAVGVAVDNKMWSAGRAEFIKFAQAYNARTLDSSGPLPADEAPRAIFNAMIEASGITS